MKFVPFATSAFSGENSSNFSLANVQGRKFANVSISFRILKSPNQSQFKNRELVLPCSGRTLPVPHLGPPTAPRSTASAALAHARESSGRGFPVASIAQPPMSLCWKSISRPVAFSTTLRTLIASAVTSGPTPSPANTQIVFFVMICLWSDSNFFRRFISAEVGCPTPFPPCRAQKLRACPTEPGRPKWPRSPWLKVKIGGNYKAVKGSLEVDAAKDNNVIFRMAVEDEEKDAVSLENESVHRVYDTIAGHFSDTRYKVHSLFQDSLTIAMATSGKLSEKTSCWICGV